MRRLEKGRRRAVDAPAAVGRKREVEAIAVGGIGWMDWSRRDWFENGRLLWRFSPPFLSFLSNLRGGKWCAYEILDSVSFSTYNVLFFSKYIAIIDV